MSFHTRIFLYILISVFLTACNGEKPDTGSDKIVYIENKDDVYTLYRNGKPFFVKGAAGFTNLKRLKEVGGNTIRTWDTVNLKQILDSAKLYDLAVVVGLPMPPSESLQDFYNNNERTGAFISKMTALVSKFKHHPALLSWCVGNELAFPYKPKYSKFYRTFNDIVDMIHRKDPDHPVTTTVMSFQTKNITNIKLRTNIDFISFNIFGSIKSLEKDLKEFKWFWDGPFLITEWSIEGPWVLENQNAWGAYIESTSTKQAEQYLEIYQKYMPVKNSRFLGSMVFYWGHKQELTPTWFSLFDENGRHTETVNVMQFIWTGKKATKQAPQVDYMLLNGKGARDNIFVKPNQMATGTLYMRANTEYKNLKFKWELLIEDWHKPDGIFSEKKPRKIAGLAESENLEIQFKAPAKEGPYRLYVYVYDNDGLFATSNTPFYVLSKP